MEIDRPEGVDRRCLVRQRGARGARCAAGGAERPSVIISATLCDKLLFDLKKILCYLHRRHIMDGAIVLDLKATISVDAFHAKYIK